MTETAPAAEASQVKSPADLIGRSASVEAPATIANLGAGYDCLGLAVELPLRVTVEAVEPGADPQEIDLTVEGDCIGELPEDRSNRFVVALEAGLAELGFESLDRVGWKIRMSNPIPLERGLGSSASATVAGLVAAGALAGLAELGFEGVERVGWKIKMSNPIPLERGLGASASATVTGLVAAGALAGRSLDTAAVLRLATRIEGHPDNVAPALLGGLVASIALDDRVEAVRIEPPRDLLVVAWIPERKLPTSEMRRVLPDAVPRTDAIANLARVAVGIAGLSAGRSDVLRLLTEDRLHEPYRAAVYPELPELVAAARAAGALGACLSGAGSTIVAFVDASDEAAADRVAAALRATAARLSQPGRLLALKPATAGARVTSP